MNDSANKDLLVQRREDWGRKDAEEMYDRYI